MTGGDPLRHYAGIENGRVVAQALTALGCRPLLLSAGADLAANLAESGAGAAVPAVLDRRFADGALPELCGDLGIVSVGPSGPCLRACIDKALAHDRMEAAGVPVPEQRLFPRRGIATVGAAAFLPDIVALLGDEVYVKPRDGFGGDGVKKARGPEAVSRALLSAFNHGEDVVIERAVAGQELTVLMTGDASDPMAVGIAHVASKSDGPATAAWARTYAPATPLDQRTRYVAVAAARGAARALGLDGLFTVDMVVDGDTAWVIDVDGLLDWRPEGALAACLSSSDVTEPQLLAGLLREAGATMRRVA